MHIYTQCVVWARSMPAAQVPTDHYDVYTVKPL